MPFAVSMSNGSVVDTSSQMGFVGKALPAAALILRDAIQSQQQVLGLSNQGPSAVAAAARSVEQAVALVDVWVQNAMTASGVVKTWFNTCQPSPFDNGGRCPPDAPTWVRSHKTAHAHSKAPSMNMQINCI